MFLKLFRPYSHGPRFFADALVSFKSSHVWSVLHWISDFFSWSMDNAMHSHIKNYLAFACGLVLVAACKHTENQNSKVSALTNDQLAKQALDILGIDRPSYTGGAVCGGSCHTNAWHTADEVFVNNLASEMTPLKACFDMNANDAKAWVDCLKTPGGEWTNKLGFYRAGLHTAMFEDKFRAAYGDSYKSTLDILVAAKGMPPLSTLAGAVPRLSAESFNIVLDWFNKGTPGLAKAFPPKKTEQVCQEDLGSQDLKDYLKNIEFNNWEMLNSERGVAMFGCPTILPEEYVPYGSARECLTDFPLAEEGNDTKSWANSPSQDASGFPLQQKMRILKEFNWRTPNGEQQRSTYWMRSSADGRFIGNGLTSNTFGFTVNYKAYVYDLKNQATKYVTANYDPAFFPNNKGFSFMEFDSAAGDRAWFCNQRILDNAVNSIRFKDYPNECYLDTMGVYQHLAVNPTGGDHIVVRGDRYANDTGAIKQYQDPSVERFAVPGTAVPPPELEVHILKENNQSYTKPRPPQKIKHPYEGDFSISPNGGLVFSRFASTDAPTPGTAVQLGYKIRKMTLTESPNGKVASLKDIGTLCMEGGKVTASFNERFLALHHYKPDPFVAPTTEQRFLESRADVYVVDLKTGKKYQITNMKKGQYGLYAHFRSDNWMYFLVRDYEKGKDYVVASDVILRIGAETSEQ